MAKEIERKFLVKALPDLSGASSVTRIVQGYLRRGATTVRVRIAGNKGVLTVKGPSQGISRAEFEYEVPLADAEEMLALCDAGVVEKVRYCLPWGLHTIELDVFAGKLLGLVMAEVELASVDTPLECPDWFGKEVSTDLRYTNAALSELLSFADLFSSSSQTDD